MNDFSSFFDEGRGSIIVIWDQIISLIYSISFLDPLERVQEDLKGP